MGGVRCSVAGQLGIHRPYFPFSRDFPDRPARFCHLQAVLKGFFEELDFPASLYAAVMLVPPETHRILGTEDLKLPARGPRKNHRIRPSKGSSSTASIQSSFFSLKTKEVETDRLHPDDAWNLSSTLPLK